MRCSCEGLLKEEYRNVKTSSLVCVPSSRRAAAQGLWDAQRTVRMRTMSSKGAPPRQWWIGGHGLLVK